MIIELKMVFISGFIAIAGCFLKIVSLNTKTLEAEDKIDSIATVILVLSGLGFFAAIISLIVRG